MDTNELARKFVSYTLRVGELDEDLVDAYFGPPELKEFSNVPEASALIDEGEQLISKATELLAGSPNVRLEVLVKYLIAVRTRAEMVNGHRYPFVEEAGLLFDAKPDRLSDEHFEELRQDLETVLPGDGDLGARWQKLSEKVLVPSDRLADTFGAAIAECRARTSAHIELPKEEDFRFELVSNKPWTAYNWFQGDSKSLIQLNSDLPLSVPKMLHLASHEGYPGHHVHSTIVESDLVAAMGYVEFSVQPLYSPFALIAEGVADSAEKVLFTSEERQDFILGVLSTVAGINPDDVKQFMDASVALNKLAFADSEAACRYLDGEVGMDETVEWLMRYRMMTKKRAAQRIAFIERYRSYVMTYAYGKKLVGEYLEHQSGGEPEIRWETLRNLLSTPVSGCILRGLIGSA